MNRMVPSMWLIKHLLLPMPIILVACGSPSMSGGFDSPNPAARIHATVKAVRDGDRQAISHIVEELDSDDPAVRILAITALERLTGETMGYRYDDPLIERDAAIERWVQALESGRDFETRAPTQAQALASGSTHE